MSWKSEIGYGALMGLGLLVAIGLIVWGARSFTAATTPINVYEVEPGVHCALATSSDGVAIDCWRVD